MAGPELIARPAPATVEGMVELGRFRGTGGLFFFSHHPWAGVVVLAIVIALVMYQGRNRR